MSFDSQPSKRRRLSNFIEYSEQLLLTSKSILSHDITDRATPMQEASSTSPENMPLSSEVSYADDLQSRSPEVDLGLQNDSFSPLERSVELGYVPVSSLSLPSSSPMDSSGSKSSSGGQSASFFTPERPTCSSSCPCIATSDTFRRNVDIDAYQLVEEDTSPTSQRGYESLSLSESDCVFGMFIPKDQWGRFKAAASTLDQTKSIRIPNGLLYRPPIGLGLSAPIYDEDLWADKENNPFLLRMEEIPVVNWFKRKVLANIQLSKRVDASLSWSRLESSLFQEKGMIGLGIRFGS